MSALTFHEDDEIRLSGDNLRPTRVTAASKAAFSGILGGHRLSSALAASNRRRKPAPITLPKIELGKAK